MLPAHLRRVMAEPAHRDDAARVPPPAHTVAALAVVALVGVGVYFKMKAKKPPASAGGGQAQGGVTLSAPDESKI